MSNGNGKGKFASTGVTVGTTSRDRFQQISENRSSNSVTMGNNTPRESEGKVGDITVRDVPSVGLRCYIKTGSGWYDVNSLIQTFRINWIDMNLQNDWERYHATTHIPPQYCKDQNGFVHFRGYMKHTGSNKAQTIFATLPAGFRPPNAISTPAYYPGSLVSTGIQIATTGSCKFVSVPATTATGQIGLDGISFFAQQRQTSIGGHSTVSQENHPFGYPVM